MDFKGNLTAAFIMLLQTGLVIFPYLITKSLIKYNYRTARIPITRKEKISDYTTSFIVVFVLTIAWLLLYDNKGGKVENLNYAKGVSMFIVFLIGTFTGIYQAHKYQKSKQVS